MIHFFGAHEYEVTGYTNYQKGKRCLRTLKGTVLSAGSPYRCIRIYNHISITNLYQYLPSYSAYPLPPVPKTQPP